MHVAYSRYYLFVFGLLVACSSPRQDREQQPAVDSVRQAVSDSVAPDSVTAPTPATVTSAKTTPAQPAQEVVAALYAAHNAEKSPFYQSESRSRIRQYFTSELASLIWRDAKSTLRGKRALLDTDPLYDGQDTDVREFSIQPAVVRRGKAEVQVTFSSLGARKTFTFLLENEKGAWRIGDIHYGDGSQLYQKLSGKEENVQ